MTFFFKWPVATLLLAWAVQAGAATAAADAGNEASTITSTSTQSARPRVSNAELSACVGGSLERYDDGATPVGEVARTIWQACRGDDSQAVADSPAAADMLHLRIRAMVTEHRNTVFAARAAKKSIGKAAGAGAAQ